eukprot:s1571_g2.t1
MLKLSPRVSLGFPASLVKEDLRCWIETLTPTHVVASEGVTAPLRQAFAEELSLVIVSLAEDQTLDSVQKEIVAALNDRAQLEVTGVILRFWTENRDSMTFTTPISSLNTADLPLHFDWNEWTASDMWPRDRENQGKLHGMQSIFCNSY